MQKLSEDRQAMYNMFMSYLSEEDNKEELTRGLEEGCWNYANENVEGSSTVYERYSAAGYRIGYCLGVELSPELWEGLVNGTFDPKRVAYMRPTEYHPTANAAVYDEIERRRAQKIELAVCTLYTCPKCRHNETSPMTYQAAAADEGSTTSLRCLNPTCGHVWRMR